MNKDNVQKAINVMQRVVDQNRAFDISRWQEGDSSCIQETEGLLHTCGMAACFGGWVAVSPEFQADGGWVGLKGMPAISGTSAGASTIAKWLGIPTGAANNLTGVFQRLYWGDELISERHTVTAQEVLDVLIRLRDTGSIWEKGH